MDLCLFLKNFDYFEDLDVLQHEYLFVQPQILLIHYLNQWYQTFFSIKIFFSFLGFGGKFQMVNCKPAEMGQLELNCSEQNKYFWVV